MLRKLVFVGLVGVTSLIANIATADMTRLRQQQI